jgi:hypothetical protein
MFPVVAATASGETTHIGKMLGKNSQSAGSARETSGSTQRNVEDGKRRIDVLERGSYGKRLLTLRGLA